MKQGHYSQAQIESRETTGYFRTVEIPEGMTCDYPHAFTALDKAEAKRLQEVGAGKFRFAGFIVEKAASASFTLSDSQGRRIRFERKGKAWRFVRSCDKGRLSGKVANPVGLSSLMPFVQGEARETQAVRARMEEQAGARGVTSADYKQRKQAGEWGR